MDSKIPEYVQEFLITIHAIRELKEKRHFADPEEADYWKAGFLVVTSYWKFLK